MNFRGTKVDGPPQTSTPKLKLFIHSRLTHETFKANIKGGFDNTKFGVSKLGVLSQTVLPKFKIFIRLNQKAKIFRIGEYERQNGKILGYHVLRSSPKWASKNLKFFNT